jgi:hypothetical protein
MRMGKVAPDGRPGRTRPMVTAALLLLAACSSRSGDRPAAQTPSESPSTTNGDAAAVTTTTTGSVPSGTALTSSTTTRSNVTSPSFRPAVTTTTSPPEYSVPDDNAAPLPRPEPFSGVVVATTTTTMGPPVVAQNGASAPGVVLTPPYEAPMVTSLGYVGCQPSSSRAGLITVTATLTGGRFWLFPEEADGNRGTFTVNYLVSVNPPFPFHCSTAGRI